MPDRRLVAALRQFGDLALHARLGLVRRLVIGPAREVTTERIALILLVKRHRFPDPSHMTIKRYAIMPAGPVRGAGRLLTRTEPPDDLVIRARQAHDDVAADPDRFRPAAEALVAEARRARQPEALALALRAVAWAERARLDDRSAIRLLDEACRIARRHHLDDTLADLLMSHAAVSQELGRIDGRAPRPARRRGACHRPADGRNWTSSGPSCCRTSGGWRTPRPSITACCPTRRPARGARCSARTTWR